jgi:hypothetical protein
MGEDAEATHPRRLRGKTDLAAHRPYVQNGGFGIEPSISEPTLTAEPHHDGGSFAYALGFDDRPFSVLLRDVSRRAN